MTAMLEAIRGRVVDTAEQELSLRVGDTVLRLLVPSFFCRSLDTGADIELLTYFVIQQEGNRLVPLLAGFPTAEDRDFFLRFITVSGVGIKAAIRALIRPSGEIARAIASGDVDGLTDLPGIGRARARKIVASLQEEMKALHPAYPTGVGAEAGAHGAAVSVLVQLGISRSEATTLVARAMDDLGEDATSSELVRKAIQGRR